MPWVALGMGALSLAGSVIGQREKDEQALADAKALGVRNAGVRFASERRADFLVKQIAGIESERQSAIIDIEKAQARAISDAKVQAAFAGVDGQAVDAVINDTERTSEEAKRSLDDSIKSERLQLKASYTDNFLNAEMQKGTVEHRRKGSGQRFLEGALSFGQGYLGGL